MSGESLGHWHAGHDLARCAPRALVHLFLADCDVKLEGCEGSFTSGGAKAPMSPFPEMEGAA